MCRNGRGKPRRRGTARAKGQPKLNCGNIEHAEQVLRPGTRLLLGETHGNAQTPRFVADLACMAARQGGAVRIGLEIPVEEDARIKGFLASAGTVSDRDALLKGPFWIDSFQDGRRSEAMLDLLQFLRELQTVERTCRWCRSTDRLPIETRPWLSDCGRRSRASRKRRSSCSAEIFTLAGRRALTNTWLRVSSKRERP